MSTDDIGGPATPEQVALAVRLDSLGLNQGNHDPDAPLPPGVIRMGDTHAATGDYRCKRCGRDEIDARQNGCPRGPCPMEPIFPILFFDGQAVAMRHGPAPRSLKLYDPVLGDITYERAPRWWRSARFFMPAAFVSFAALVIVGVRLIMLRLGLP
jgi:hypothetical protein